MEISAEVISGLQLVNSGVIEKEFIEQILEHVESSLISSNRSNSDLEGKIFAVLAHCRLFLLFLFYFLKGF